MLFFWTLKPPLLARTPLRDTVAHMHGEDEGESRAMRVYMLWLTIGPLHLTVVW